MNILVLVPLGALALAQPNAAMVARHLLHVPGAKGVPTGVCQSTCARSAAQETAICGPVSTVCSGHHCVRMVTHRFPRWILAGRRALNRRCGGCEIPLMGKHAGRAPERLVGIVGGPGSGKDELPVDGRSTRCCDVPATASTRLIHGEIDDENQKHEFQRQWQNLAVWPLWRRRPLT